MDFDLPRWTAVLRELVRIPSSFEREPAVLARVDELLREIGGVEIHLIPHDATHLAQLPDALPPFSAVLGRHSLVAILRGTGGGRSLALNAHLDTAPVGDPAHWNRPPLSGDFDPATGLVHGRGAMDDKAGVVILLAVLATLRSAPRRLRGDLFLHLVIEDEITGNGTLLCLDAGHRADAAFIVDGTRLDRAIREHAGQLTFSLTITGRTASVCVSHLGVNAAEVAARLALALREFIHSMNATRPITWQVFPSPYQCSVQSICAEGDVFTLPDRAVLKFFATFCPPDTLASMRGKIAAFVSDFAKLHALPDVPVVDQLAFAAEPVASPPGELDRLLAARGVIPGPSTGTSDLRHYVAAGIPCLLYGPGGGGNPHRPDEFYPAADLENLTRFYTETARTWCDESPSP